MGQKQPINAKEKQVIEQQNYLSDDFIIEEILIRLPVKSVLRFKSVSKQWYSTLSSSDFANTHLIKSLFFHRSAPVNTLFIKNLKNYYLFSYHDGDGDGVSDNFEDNLVKLDVEDLGFQNYNAELTGSCNGLICLTIFSNKCVFSQVMYRNSDASYFIIWNPATRKVHWYDSDGYLKGNIVGYPPIVAHGFGYASSVGDYKYLRILTSFYHDSPIFHEESPSIVHIFSLRENKWRKIDCAFYHDKVIPEGRAVLIDEKLYWKAYSITQPCTVSLSFDLEAEQFEIIHHQLNVNSFDSVIGVLGGCLSRWDYGSTNEDDKLMHILEPPTSVKSICLPKEFRLDVVSQMIGFTRTGKIFVTGTLSSDEVMYNASDSQITLQLLDIGRKPMQHSILMNFNGLVDIAKYVPSLASPFPIEEPSET